MFDEGTNIVTMKLPAKGETYINEDALPDYSLEYWNGQKRIQFWRNKKQ